MNDALTTIPDPARAVVVVPVGRNTWTKKEITLQYEASRLIKVEGIDITQSGPMGLTGILFMVKESVSRDNRTLMRVERQKIVNGKVVELQNWGEIEETVAKVA